MAVGILSSKYRQINLGSGPHVFAGWTNIDQRDTDASPNVLASIMAMPFADNTIERVYMGHVLEHLGLFYDMKLFTEELFRVCKSGAECMIVGPDVAAFNDLFQAHDSCAPAWLLQAVVSSKPEWATWETDKGGWHRWVPTSDLMIEVLEFYGFVEVRKENIETIRLPTWPNKETAKWQMAISARTP
jgi:predicted SAM-dependent methyltransferase